MEVILINPQGYCEGVSRALNKINKLIDCNNTYMLGEIIHNKIVVDYYKQKGIILLSEANDKAKSIENIYNSKIILQAHGSSQEVYDIAKKNNNIIIDCTCPYVKLIHNNIIKYSNLGYDIVYIGSKKHAETVASLAQAKNTYLVETASDIDNLNLKNKIYATNQTTMSLLDIEIIYDKLKEKYPDIIIDNKICLATTKRQKAVLEINDADLVIVVGDKTSSNTNKLYYIAAKKFKTVLIESVNELYNYNFDKINKVYITSGASTPHELVYEVKNFLDKI